MIDLHTHSTFSDGENAPSVLVEQASKIGLRAIALTDHDNVGGCFELQQAAQKYPSLLALAGCEFSVDHPANMEIIALNITNLDPYLERQKIMQQNRMNACFQRVEKLQKLGYHITWDDVLYDENKNQRKTIVKPHIVNFLFETGQIKDQEYAYRELLDKGCPAYVELKSPQPEEVIDFIRSTKAVAVLAHPCLIKLKRQDLFNEIARLQKCGLQGMEVQHSDMTADEMAEYNQIADTLGLLKSGGSDFHGKNTHPGVELGFGKGNLNIPDEYVEKIIQASTSKTHIAQNVRLTDRQR